MEQIIQFDHNLFLYLNNLGNSNWDSFWLFVTNKYSWIPFYAFVLFIWIKNFGVKKGLVIAIGCIALITLTDQTSNLLKHGLERYRPCHTESLDGLFRLVKNNCGGRFGFTSAHSANSFAFAVFLSLLMRNRWITTGMLCWAAIVAYSRVYVGVHFPFDILFGAILGIVYAFVVSILTMFILKKYF